MNEKMDMLKFRELANDRESCIRDASSKEVSNHFQSNELAKLLHLSIFWVTVKEIREESSHTKTFVLEASQDHESRLPRFQAGQYITLEVLIDGGIYRRPYTISCSPKHLDSNEITITIDRVTDGVVSNYFLDDVQVNDTFAAHGPFGNFTYQSLRDSKNIIGIAGGSGITPFLSMAEAVVDGILDISLTLIYGAKTEQDLLFKEKLDAFSNHENIHVHYLLSEEEKDGYDFGFISKELIEKYQKEENSYFICGPLGLYESMNEILKELHIPNKYIRHDLYENYERGTSFDTYRVCVLTGDEEKVIYCKGNETLMSAMERSGIKAPKKCGVGVCGFCRSKLISGDVLTSNDYVRKVDQKYYYIHPCASFPVSDVTIRLPK